MNKNQNESLSPRPFILASAVLAAIWLVAAWMFAHTYIYWQARQVFRTTESRAHNAFDELHRGLNKTLTYMQVVPELASRETILQRALRDLNHRGNFTGMERKDIRAFLDKNPLGNTASSELAKITGDIETISEMFLIRKDGVCIASSNHDAASSFVGVRYEDRTYFKAAMSGKRHLQYAMGRQTNIPGIFFSAPVRAGDEIIGVIVSKIDLPYLNHLTKQTNGFVVDKYGVIVLGPNRDFEMMALPGATVHDLDDTTRLLRYKLAEIPTLDVSPWENGLGSRLFQVNSQSAPSYMLYADMENFHFKLMVLVESAELGLMNSRRQNLFLVLLPAGTLLIMLVVALAYQFRALQLARKARQKQELMEQLAHYDALTGLYARSQTDRLTAQCIEAASGNSTQFAVMHVDVDLFKDVNDSFGLEIGDETLRELATRIRQALKGSDIVIRHGGDEFVVLAPDIGDPESVATMAATLLATIKTPFMIQENAVSLSASIGISLYPHDGETTSLLLRHAEAAMLNVKNRGRGDYTFYETTMSDELAARKALEADMERGLDNNEFFLVYQPKLSLATGKISGCEALLRWKHSSGRIIPPNEFIPIAERSGFINVLGEWVINEACRQSGEWQTTLGKTIPVSVNLSAVQFQHSDLVGIIRRATVQHHIDPGKLEMEITETLLMDDTRKTLDILDEIKMLGVRISIDDFGTGYSSLAYLKQFAADALKIDRLFVKDMESNSNSHALISAIISMANNLDYQTVAEGVETQEQHDLLLEMGCTEIQGFWFSRPLTPDAFVTFYAKNRDTGHENLAEENWIFVI